MIRFRKNYPAIIIASSDGSSTATLRHDLSSGGIYSHVFDLATAKDNIDAADVIIILSDEYSSPAVALIDEASKKEGLSVFYCGDPADVASVSDVKNLTVIPHSGSAGSSGDSAVIAEAVTKIMTEKYKISPIYAEDDEIICELTKPAQVFYNGTKLPLSKSEARIVHFLLTVEERFLVSREIIGEFLSLAPGAVPVHIHNINDKSMKIYHDKLIFSRSSKGYFVY